MDREQMTIAVSSSSQRRSPLHRYQDIDLASRVQGSTPHALVAMLYGELSIALDVMVRAIDTGDVARQLQQHERSSTILHTLEAGLDRVRGGDLALSLSGIYRQMRRRLIEGRGGDVTAVIEVRNGVTSLAEAWLAIAA